MINRPKSPNDVVQFSVVFTNPLSTKDRESLRLFIVKEMGKYSGGSFSLNSNDLSMESIRRVVDKVTVYLFRHGVFFRESKELTYKVVH